METDKKPSKTVEYKFYTKRGTRYVKFQYDGKDYDLPERDARKIIGALGGFFLFLFFLAMLSND